MAFSLGDDEQQGMTEMNLIPLIDIMLVLMIIFLVTATVANPSLPVTLPDAKAEIQKQPPETINISIDAQNQVAYNGEIISLDELNQRLKDKAQQAPETAIQLMADKESKYDTTAQVMSRASEAGLKNLYFATE
ncbi:MULTISPECIES: ExbD/TolR family protein [unclassified Acinetobacter]|uniref:ExbD/TolR family protein n=1 Tax=unclassified Acinetobacter TaxID=196816 RepID=UPI0035B806CD